MSIRLRSGIFFPPIHPLDEDPTLCIQRDLELVDHLDRIGFEEAWMGEHHSGGYELISSPELFIAAAAERTKRIRLGTGVISLPYHHPLMVANRIIQLDHQTKGRLMVGFGPGLLAEDAMQMGIDPNKMRDRMVESLEVIVRLLDGERVTCKTEWFELVEARCHCRPYSWPRPEIAVASVVTPSGAKLAGRNGFAMLCLAATQRAGLDALGSNWELATQVAAEHGQVMDRNALRLVGPIHLAETRAQARENINFGFRQWAEYFNSISPLAYQTKDAPGDPIDYLIDRGDIIVGTPDDAIEMIGRLHAKQGEFGCFLHNAHNWANFENTKRSYELWQRFVIPAVNGLNTRRQEAFDFAADQKNAARFQGASASAIQNAIEKHERTASPPAMERAASG